MRMVSEAQYVFHTEDSFFVVNEFCCEDGACREALAIVCSVYDLDIIDGGTVFDHMCSWRWVDAFADDAQIT